MKKLFIPMAVLVIGLVLFLACGEAGMEERSSIDQLRDQYSVVGIEHNEGLKYVYEKLASTPNISSLSYDEGLLLIENANKEFVASKYDIGINEVLCKQISDLFHTYKNKEIFFAKSSFDEDLFNDPEITDSLSENQLALLNELDQILSEDLDLSSKSYNIEELEERALLILSERERPPFYSATNVAKYSILYWTENYSMWESILTSNDSSLAKPTNFWGDLRDLAGADAFGAVVGALGGLATGGTASIPLAAVVGLSASTLKLYDMIVSE
ncbi:MAG: hypothetical protein U9O95_06295 [Candidatus Marinimicrobia bacterium]|nr:hypothetical protein [Candidatus Neomarinimicrobiota bacterium]